jgi:mRNA interferase RelE/StbE
VAAYSIFIKKSAARELEALGKKDLRRVLERIEALAENPRAAGAEKLAGVELWRIRQGDYRIVYSIEDSALTVWIIKV